MYVSVYMHAPMFNDRDRQLTWQWCEPHNHQKPCNVLQIPVRMADFFFQGMVFQIITDGDDIKIVTSILMLLPL